MTKFQTEPFPHMHRTMPAPEAGGAGSPFGATNPWNDGPAELPPWSGRVIGGKYAVSERLGSGGMGEVYRASHMTLGTPVAIKVMHAHVAAVPEYARRFRREAHAASRLRHRNVVHVLDFGDEGGTLFIAMELLVGQSLATFLHTNAEPPPLTEVTDIFIQVLDAFEAAHAAGIVHRDLKAENVFLSVEGDGRRVVKVVDFGLAHVDDLRDQGPTLTRSDMVSGTPEYMSPEQCRSLVVGPSTDLYAIGCLLTEMLQLSPPFRGNAVEVMTQQMFVPPPPLARPKSAEPVPPLLDQLRTSLLAKAPEHRPADVAEVRRLFVEAMDAEAASIKLPSRKPVNEGRLERSSVRPTEDRADAPLSAPIAGVRLIRLTQRDDGVSQSCLTGLAAQGIFASIQEPGAPEEPGSATLLDAAEDLDGAVAWLSARRGHPAVIVCLADVTTARMNALIAAGAKDIVPYPVTSDIVGRKIRRALKSKATS